MSKRKARPQTRPRIAIDDVDEDVVHYLVTGYGITDPCQKNKEKKEREARIELLAALRNVNDLAKADAVPARELKQLEETLRAAATAVEHFQTSNPFAPLIRRRQNSDRALRQFPAVAAILAGELAALAVSKINHPRSLSVLALAYLIALVDLRTRRLRPRHRNEALSRLAGRSPEALAMFRHRHRSLIKSLAPHLVALGSDHSVH